MLMKVLTLKLHFNPIEKKNNFSEMLPVVKVNGNVNICDFNSITFLHLRYQLCFCSANYNKRAHKKVFV